MSDRFVVDKDNPCLIHDTKSPNIFLIYLNPNDTQGELDLQRTERMSQFLSDKLNKEWVEETENE